MLASETTYNTVYYKSGRVMKCKSGTKKNVTLSSAIYYMFFTTITALTTNQRLRYSDQSYLMCWMQF